MRVHDPGLALERGLARSSQRWEPGLGLDPPRGGAFDAPASIPLRPFPLRTKGLTMNTAFASLAALALASLLASCESSRVLDPQAEYFKGSLRTYFDTGKDDADELDLFKDGGMGAAVDFLSVSFPYLMHRGAGMLDVDAAVEFERAKRREIESRVKELQLKTEALRNARSAAPEGDATARAKADQDLAATESQLALLRLDAARQSATVQRAEKLVTRADGTRLDGDWTWGPRISAGLTGPAGNSSDSSNTSSGTPVAYVGVGLFADFQKGGSEIGRAHV